MHLLKKQTLFKSLLSIGFGDENAPLMKRGGVIASFDNTRPVKRSVTAKAQQQLLAESVENVIVGQYSHIEIDHILSNFEMIGVGKLRVYGSNVIDDEEVISFLRMKTGSIGLNVLNDIIV